MSQKNKKIQSNRLDLEIVKRGLLNSREKAKAYIMAGEVTVDGLIAYKPGAKVKSNQKIELKSNPLPYVSRGGLKLEKALELFDIDLVDSICIDMGASTGGFTDCMLKKGASKVYAIDVGYGQLDYRLRNDSRVVVIERTNIRTMDLSLIEEEADFISIDVSFISLNLILPVAQKVLKCRGEIICLIKPQFEAGRSQVGKKGIVRDPKVHEEVILKVIAYASACKLQACNLTYSPVQGAKGNVEYLLHLRHEEAGPVPEFEGKKASQADKELSDSHISPDRVRKIVSDSHKEFI